APWTSCATRPWARRWGAAARSTCARSSSPRVTCATTCGSSAGYSRAPRRPRPRSRLTAMGDGRGPLVLVSNRGPVTYQDDGSVRRGGGGLVTALTGLASHRDAVWIASAMTDADAERSREAGGKPFTV